MADKLSRDQLRRATRSRVDLTGGEVSIVYVRRHAPDGDEPEVLVQRWAWEDTRPASVREQSPGDWDEDAVELVREHAEAHGPGVHQYRVETRDAGGVVRASTWCRVTVRRDPHTATVEATGADLDGSVAAWQTHLAAAYEAERRARVQALDALQAGAERMLRLLDQVAARVESSLAREVREREEVEAELIAIAREREKQHGSRHTPIIDEEFAGVLRELAPVVMDRVMERLAPSLEPFLAGLLPGADASEAAASAVEAAGVE